MVRTLVVLVLVVLLAACGNSGGSSGGGGAATPQAAVEQALGHATRGEKIAFAKLLSSGARGKSSADIQLEILSEWLLARGLSGFEVDGAALEGWDALQLADSTSATATVTTILRFRGTGEPAERPVPLEIDLVNESGAWRIADARMKKPFPAWYTTLRRERTGYIDIPGEPQAPVDPPPPLAEIAATYRPPPPNWKR